MVIPGILETKQEEALKKIQMLDGTAPVIQIDIADGLLVEGKTFMDLSFLETLKLSSRIQIHLMIQKPGSFLLTLPTNVKDVCAHAEAFLYNPNWEEGFHDVLKSKNSKVGLSFNFGTPFEDFKEWILKCDYIQLMGVNPGGQSRPFIMESLDKIKSFKKEFPGIFLQVDGGISEETVRMVGEAGADAVVVGSAIFTSPDPLQSYKNFMLQFEGAHRNFYYSQQHPLTEHFGGEKSF